MDINTKENNVFFDKKGNVLIDVKEKLSDIFYDSYIENFKKNTKKRLFYKFIKRSLDCIVSFLFLIILSPIFLILALAIKIDSKGPIVFKQTRIGKGGKEFYCYKFRSMRIDSPHDCPTSLLDNPELYQTRVGKFLRRTSLDEIPQLWCVFIGKMSIIGYRPLVKAEENCNNMREELGVFEMRPGITGYAQVKGRDDVYYKNKAILDAEYVRRASTWFDIKLFFETLKVVVSKEGNASKNVKDKNINKEQSVDIEEKNNGLEKVTESVITEEKTKHIIKKQKEVV